MSDYDNMTPEEKAAMLKGLSMQFTNQINGFNGEDGLPPQIEREMRIFFNCKSFLDEESINKWQVELITYLNERCTPMIIIDVELAKFVGYEVKELKP